MCWGVLFPPFYVVVRAWMSAAIWMRGWVPFLPTPLLDLEVLCPSEGKSVSGLPAIPGVEPSAHRGTNIRVLVAVFRAVWGSPPRVYLLCMHGARSYLMRLRRRSRLRTVQKVQITFSTRMAISPKEVAGAGVSMHLGGSTAD